MAPGGGGHGTSFALSQRAQFPIGHIMMQSHTKIWLLALVVACGSALSSCSSDIATPESGIVSEGACSSDLSCPYGEECGAGACVPLAPGLYPHIQTASALFREYADAEELAWRAAHYDLLVSQVLNYVDEIRAVNPGARLFEYMNARYHRYDDFGPQATDWAIANGYDPEDFYLHYREDVAVPTWESTVIVDGFPPGIIPGWNPDAGPGDPPASALSREVSRVIGYNAGGHTTGDPWRMANINHEGYRRFLLYWATRVLDGSLDGHNYRAQPLDGVVFDNAIYYPMFGEGVLDKTDEYYGIPLEPNHPHAIGFSTLYPFITDGLASEFNRGVDVMPNFGHVLFLDYTDPAPRAVVQSTPWIWPEVWLMFRGGNFPTTGSVRVVTYDSDYRKALLTVIRQSRDSRRRILGIMDLSQAGVGSDRGRLFSLAMYYLAHSANTFYLYEATTTHSSSLHLSQWAWNAAVEFDVGRPDQIPNGITDFDGNSPSIEHWIFAEGADPYRAELTYRVLARRFTNALVLAKMLPAGSVVDDRSITTHVLDGSYAVLNADGSLGDVVTSIDIRNNEGVILIPVD